MPQKVTIIGIVKRRLWRSGYHAVDMSGTSLGFDLLVEGKFKVIVIKRRTPADLAKKQFTDDEISFAKSGGIFAVALTATFGAPLVMYAVGNSLMPLAASKAFGLPASKSKVYEKKGRKKDPFNLKGKVKKNGLIGKFAGYEKA